MVCYINTTRYNKCVFVISNIMAIVALYLAGINFIIKINVFLVFFLLSFAKLRLQCSIRAFYLTTVKNKSLLLISPINQKTKDIQVKVTFVKVVYFSSVMIVLKFANTLKNFNVVVFKGQVDTDQFKALIILAKYGFLPAVV